MNITCPYCHFSQDVPAERLPAVAPGKSILATCPRCSHRFRLFPHEGTTQLLEGNAAGAAAAESGSHTPPPAADAEENESSQPAQTAIEEDEDPRMSASRAYAREAERGRRLRQTVRRKDAGDEPEGEEDESSDELAPLRNPWEDAPERNGYIEGFYQTVLRVMFGAPRFFAGMRDDAPPLRALSFFLIVSVIGVTALHLWSKVFLSMIADASDPQMQSLAGILPPEGSALFYGLVQLFLLVVQLYVVSGLVFLSFRLSTCRTASYARVFQIVAYSSAPMILCVIPVLGYLAGFIWCLAGIVIGCRAAFRLSWAQALVGCLPIVLLLAMLLRQTLGLLSVI